MTGAVGVIGLGQMGGAMARNLVRAGFDVAGYDVAPGPLEQLERDGGTAHRSAEAVTADAEIIVTSLPSPAALIDTLTGPGGLVQSSRRPLIVVETSTLRLADKQEARALAQHAGIVLLDCPLSGTGKQALDKDLAVYASGDERALEQCRAVFDGFARAHHLLGDFGAGTKMKLVANLLVTIHNAATAEALVLGMKAGLDPAQVYDVIRSGAGTSRIFEVRGPLMVEDSYAEPGITGVLYRKDIDIIDDYARSLSSPVPLFSASGQLHAAALAQGLGELDTAAVCRVYEQLAGDPRSSDG